MGLRKSVVHKTSICLEGLGAQFTVTEKYSPQKECPSSALSHKKSRILENNLILLVQSI